MSTESIYRYKLDFYYQQTLIYLATLVLYVVIKGTIVQDQFTVIYRDPLLYIIALFVLFSAVVLLLNRIRDRQLIVRHGELIFHSRRRERILPIADIEWMHIGRERLVQTAGRYQVIVVKIKDRRRPYRVRIGRYEREGELLADMQRIAREVPKRKRRPFRMKRQRSL
jgi:hypothetical protein